MKVIYKADDGTEFGSEVLCVDYENSKAIDISLANLSVQDVNSALKCSPQIGSRRIGAAIEKAARIIAQARIDAGDAKRKTKPKAIPEAPTAAEIVTDMPAGASPYPTAGNPFPSRVDHVARNA